MSRISCSGFGVLGRVDVIISARFRLTITLITFASFIFDGSLNEHLERLN